MGVTSRRQGGRPIQWRESKRATDREVGTAPHGTTLKCRRVILSPPEFRGRGACSIVKQIPASVVLSCVRAVRDPFHTANRHDLSAVLKIWRGLPCVHPVCIKEQPRRPYCGEVDNEPV